jgi:hypothetical protein
MKWLRKSMLALAGLLIVVFALAAHYYRDLNAAESEKIARKAQLLRSFADAHGYSSRAAFLVDMHLPSGRNRFFVYDLTGDSILLTGLVAHGCGSQAFSIDPSFSNVDGSNCTALGKYRIGKPYKGQFGLAYKLYGLDPTNDHAFDRNIVLHSYSSVPERKMDPYPICNSRGCPMVAPGFLQLLQPVIDGSKKPVLLWIFD